MTNKTDFRGQVLAEGVPAAYDAMMRVLRDPRSSATAVSSISRTMLEAGGVLSVPENDGEKEPHEMSADELHAKIARLRAEAINRAKPVIDVEPRRIDQQKGTDGVFE